MPLFINFFPCTYIQISIISYYFTLPCFTNFLFYVRQLLFIFYYFFYIIRNFNKFWIKIDCLCISKFSFIFIKPIIIICIYTIWMKSIFKPVYVNIIGGIFLFSLTIFPSFSTISIVPKSIMKLSVENSLNFNGSIE